MAIHEFTLSNLGQLDYGVAEAAMRMHLKRAVQDMSDRPVCKQPRTITMTIALVPAPNDDGTIDRCKAQIRVESKIPKHQTRVYDLALRATGQLAFSEESPDKFDQTTLFDEEA